MTSRRLEPIRAAARGFRSRSRAAGSILALGLLVAPLAACSGDGPRTPDDSGSGAATITGTAIDATCDELVPASALTGQWAGYAPDDAVERSAQSTEISGYDGLVCSWSDESTDGTFQIAVADLDSDIIEALKNEMYRTSHAVPSYGNPPAVEGYFSADSGPGVAEVFVDDFWISSTGTAYVEPGDPAPLLIAAISGLTD